ncbi:MAG: polysaccharide deacetylase family protein [bacterium]
MTARAPRWRRLALAALAWVTACAGEPAPRAILPVDPPPVDPASYTIDLDRTALMSRGHGVLLVGYDVEASGLDDTAEFLRKAAAIHRAARAPATFFPTGWTLEHAAAPFRALEADPLFEVESHTYTHERLKPLVERSPAGTRFLAAAESAAIEHSLERSVAAVRSVLGRAPSGITIPYGAHRGLADRPDLLASLDRAGFVFVRSYARNADDWQPVDFDVQPRWYALQGFPRILEIPIQGWQDALWRETHGWDDVAGYRRLLDEELAIVASRNRVWSYCAHDWSSLRGDPELELVRHLLARAAALGIVTVTHRDFYAAALAVAPPPKRDER